MILRGKRALHARWPFYAMLVLTTAFCAVDQRLPTAPRRERANVVPAGGPIVFDTVSFARRAWATAGRRWVAANAGLRWTPNGWQLDSTWVHDDVAPKAYFVEYAVRPALSLAEARNSVALLDELATLYLAYLPRFKTLGQLRARKSALVSTDMIDSVGRDDDRIIPWREATSLGYRERECANCSAQFLHPAARLLGDLARLRPEQRTMRMKEFAQAYVPLIVRDHLQRLSFEAKIDHWGLPDAPRGLVPIWSALLDGRIATTTHYQRSLLDRDLWIMATAAELLGAHAADPAFVPIGDAEGPLHAIVTTGVRFLETKRKLDPTTTNFAGVTVGSVSLFNGDLDDFADYAYAGDTLPDFPTSRGPTPLPGVSWDISHAYRIPVALRSFATNRAATGVAYPSDAEIGLIVNQYVYRVFNGDLTQPRFRTFFDGADGWFRVEYAGRAGYGIPPSRYCDSRDSKRPCLTEGALMGWGLLAGYSSDLQVVLRSVVRLAVSNDRQQIDHRARYFGLGKEEFAVQDSLGRATYPFMLFGVVSEMMGQTTNTVLRPR